MSGKEAIPDGTGSREGMFSARFDGKETERLFRQVYKILKDLNYSVLMVEEGVGGDFGDSTAIFLGRLRKRKGVMLSVCSWHYGQAKSTWIAEERMRTGSLLGSRRSCTGSLQRQGIRCLLRLATLLLGLMIGIRTFGIA